MDILHAVSGLLVGALVGLTGVGGGSLMAPILILLIGVAPATAVGTDLWFAAITKLVGGTVHHRYGDPDWQVVRRLACGSVPAAIVTLIVLSQMHMGQVKQGFIMSLLGGALILTALATLSWGWIRRKAAGISQPRALAYRRVQPGLTVAAGAILGVLVSMTSVGAGALGATMLLALYPRRMTPARLVGTDIVHAVPLTMVAGLGHLWLGNVNFTLLGSLLVGSIPGILIGSLLATRVSGGIIRPFLAVVLVASGLKMLLS
ncbi:sulfite exporter TauE/SafE family protein [Sphingobium sufflavum]|uniref:sulfite exporter TauE/SafE family protein n=1 Tax=Sphingobium sufflavum TaxID=1129547 RepID=UPI001F3AAFA3|nr:sulfite exporter TauE/SafE family protein [Sphingobium sufflavum]MCE7795901.1 sulfite exporter TauE/SafE family protein [Sphingobium sufflavum]